MFDNYKHILRNHVQHCVKVLTERLFVLNKNYGLCVSLFVAVYVTYHLHVQD